MPKLPLVFKTYQDVKNNLVYWTMLLLMVSTAIIYLLILNHAQRQPIIDFVTSLGSNGFVAAVASGLIIVLYAIFAVGLIYAVQIHDLVYDSKIIRWRERYDVDFILTKLTEPLKSDLPTNFADFAVRYRYQFMKPYYDFVGDGKRGIEENTRIRFYERVTWYWVTQLNEIFILLFLIGTPIYVLVYPGSGLSLNSFATFMLVLVVLGLINRWLIRLTRNATAQATIDEIDEILEKQENIERLRESYKKLCVTYRL